ncbi:MAG: aminotransferase class III-fold pyridoxal phosphate-dependent enzyme, partial [Phycisphaerae bacterium]|nr:aminotransferase class III-fold pyridoxal phosphate-dependent enzyme [Phycisphaerae bacterium]
AGKTPKSCNIECFESMQRLVEEHGKRLAAVIVEPLCQAAAGMRVYPAEYLRRLRILCDSHGLLLIADEVAMGFGRSGRMFACNHAGISPDILCLGKAMTGGYLPMSATVVTERIYDAFRSSPTDDRTFHHGHTFSGNPLAAAVALAVLDVFEDEKILNNAEPLVAALAKGMGEMADLGPVEDTRCLGMIGAVEFSCGDGGEDFARRVCSEARGRGLHIRPLDNVVYLWPPLTITPAELREAIAIVNDSIAAVSRGIQP